MENATCEQCGDDFDGDDGDVCEECHRKNAISDNYPLSWDECEERGLFDR